ncbi:MAG: macro domain-containing protein [Candidatus Asgardarchaeum sp.]
MFLYIEGNLFEAPAQTLVNTVNTVGAMGKGLAKEFKRLFPDMFNEYQKLCEKRKIDIGSLWLFRTSNKWVLNFPTKKHWRQPSKFEYIEKGLKTFTNNYSKARIFSIAFPKLGCGNGELDWDDVKPLMERYLKKLPINIYVYLSNGNLIPEHKKITEMRKWLMTEPRSYPYSELKSDLENVLSLNNIFKTNENNSFSSIIVDDGILIKYNDQETLLPWEGDEINKGLLELWQFIRDKGICRTRDISEMGIPNTDCIITLLTNLPYIKPIEIIGDDKMSAVQLAPKTKQPSLFDHQNNYSYIDDF